MEYAETAAACIPKLGLGTWQNTGRTCVRTVQTALEMGYRHVDTAQMYDNEAAVGEGIARADVDREDVFVTTKVWRSNLRYRDVVESVHASLDRLGLSSVDLLLIHWPHPRVPLEETLSAMVELSEEGATEHIGVSNFTRSQLAAARAATSVPIVADQVLYHPYNDQADLLASCRDHDVALTAYSPLARGDVLSDPVLERIGDRYGKSPAQVALRWLVQQDGVVAIPKATSREHLAANAAVFDFSLSADEMARVRDQRGPLRVRLRRRLPSLMRRLPL
jgi:diketogulonate reductase-like aldo/keto reductase